MSIFDKVNDKGGDDHWRNEPRDNGPMFSKWKDAGAGEHPKGKFMDTFNNEKYKGKGTG